MSLIRIFMCCHKQYEAVPPLCEPIQCGAALGPAIEGIIRDSAGDNISEKNREYCELTAHYFAWKNIDADYYGFCHYRRFFGADGITKRPYLALNRASDRQFPSEEELRALADEYCVIIPRSEDMGFPAGEHYITSRFHYVEDLSLFLEILKEKAPQLYPAAEEYLRQNRQYFCNMFIMRRELFCEYCGILFPVLEEFDKRKTLHGGFQSDRTDGYLGELFTGIYVAHCCRNGVKVKELPRLDVGCSVKKRLGCALLPPESRRRFAAKRLVKAVRGK